MRFSRSGALGLLVALGLLLCAIPRSLVAQEVQAVPGPSDLQATAVSPSRINLKWTRVNTGLVVEYRIYRYPSNALIASVPASQDSYADTGLSPWTEYRYYVTGATSSGNESGPSNVATARTLDGTPPTAPGNLTGAASGSREITLTWTAASDPQSGVSGYVVYRNDAEVGQTTQLSYIDGSLQRDTQYSYKVTAVNSQGDEGAPAGPFQVRTPPPSPPGAPRDLSADALSPTEVALDWRPPQDDDDVEGYRVYRNGSPIATPSGSDYRDSGLAPFTVYEYRVTAFDDDDDESSPSNAASVRTLDATPPTEPGNLAGSAVSQTQISLSWAAATDPQTGVAEYVVYRGGSEIGRTSSLTFQDDGLTTDTQYSYGVSAVNGQGDEGSRAGPVQVRTLEDSTPDPPRDLTATTVSASAIDLSWRPPADES
ncbi:MAG: fibronectin type III domain-containing protein, partial [marine benthic group bacterium]|nr:fibronectin type III domain-containing protein [Gemmatimonadota bacterium]